MHYLETKSLNPYYNLAFEDYILTNKKDGNYLILWQNNNTIVIGRNQNAEGEINRKYVEEENIKVVRRMTGGGAVYHDMGNLNYSLILDLEDSEKVAFKSFMEPMVECLKSLGLDAKILGRNDILIGDKKVSGNAQRLKNGRILHHGTLLFNSSSDRIAKALNVDVQKYKSKGISSIKSRVGNIKDFLKEDMNLEQFWAYVKDFFIDKDVVEYKLTTEDIENIKDLENKKYSTWKWNFGNSPNFEIQNKRKWDSGVLEVHLNIKEGKITGIKIYGDYLALIGNEELVNSLIGSKYARNHTREILEKHPIKEMFGGIDIDEILDTFFYTGD